MKKYDYVAPYNTKAVFDGGNVPACRYCRDYKKAVQRMECRRGRKAKFTGCGILPQPTEIERMR